MILPVSGNINYNRGQSFKGCVPFIRTKKNFSINTEYKSIDVHSADYIKYVYRLVKGWCKQTCEVNVETERLQDIVKDKEPCIFIMNHTRDQIKDINAAKFFNNLLYREYIYHNMAETCPRSKVMASKNYVSHAGDGGERLRWLGVVPVSTSLKTKTRKSENANTLKELTNQFANNEINLFLFPEGAFAAFTFLPLKYKFQAGAAYIIRNALETKDKVKVVPLCFAHKNDISAIHIGEALYISRQNENYYASRGNADSKFFNKDLAKIYKDNDKILLTDSGKALKYENVIPYISGVLMRNMECCTKDAKQDLKQSKSGVFIL